MGKEIEKAFESATALILGTKLSGLDGYAEWLKRYTEADPLRMKSAVSDQVVLISSTKFYRAVKKNMVKMDEAWKLGERGVDGNPSGITLSSAGAKLGGIKYISPEGVAEPNIGIDGCTLYGYSNYCYRSTGFVECKYCAYSFWPRQSENCFGCRYVFSSKFCIKCYYSTSLTRCFEVSDSNNCSDCYFCHNCEGLSNCMFCFNAKSLKYAIGNVEVGRERYMQVKKLVLEGIGKRLGKGKDLKWSICNLG